MIHDQGTHIVFRGQRVLNFIEYARLNSVADSDVKDLVKEFCFEWEAAKHLWYCSLEEALGLPPEDFKLWQADPMHLNHYLDRFRASDPKAVSHEPLDLFPGYSRIASAPDMRGGAPSFYQHGFQLYFFYSHMSAGLSIEEFKESYGFTDEDVQEAFEFAIDSAQRRGMGVRFFTYHKSFTDFWLKTMPDFRRLDELLEKLKEHLVEGLYLESWIGRPMNEIYGWTPDEYEKWQSGELTVEAIMRLKVADYEDFVLGRLESPLPLSFETIQGEIDAYRREKEKRK